MNVRLDETLANVYRHLQALSQTMINVWLLAYQYGLKPGTNGNELYLFVMTEGSSTQLVIFNQYLPLASLIVPFADSASRTSMNWLLMNLDPFLPNIFRSSTICGYAISERAIQSLQR